MDTVKTVVVSGGFDPLHVGHIRMMKEAHKLGKLTVILNNDDFLRRKKGYVFMPLRERKEIIENLWCVSKVVVAFDYDQNIDETLRVLKPDFFAHAGDVDCPEKVRERGTCEQLGIKLVFFPWLTKEHSSSEIVRRAKLCLV